MVGPFIARSFSFISVPVFSYYLTLNEYGTYNLFTILLMYFVPLITLGTEQFYLRDYNKENGYLIRKVILYIFITLFIVLLFLLMGYQYFTGNNSLFNVNYYYLYLALVISFFNAIQDIYIRTIRYYGFGELYSKILFITQFLTFIVSTILVMIYKNVFSLIISSLFTSIISLLITNIALKVKIRGVEEQPLLIEDDQKKIIIMSALKFSLPLLPGIFLWVLQSTIDRFFISNFLSMRDLGLFSVGFKFASIIALFTTSFLIFWEPKLYIFYDEHKNSIKFKSIVEEYKNIYKIFVNTVILGILLLLPLGIKLMNQSYQSSLYIIPLMLYSNFIHGFNYFSGMGPQLKKKTLISIVPLVCALLVNIIFNLIFISKLGILAVLLSTNISFLILLSTNYFITKRIINMVPSILSDWLNIFIQVLVSTFYFINRNFYVFLLLIFFLYTIDIFINRKSILRYIFIAKRLVETKFKKQSS